MLHAIIIISPSSQTRNNKAENLAQEFLDNSSLVNNPDFKIIEDEKSLKIESIRNLQKFLTFKPYKFTHTVTWLKDAHSLSLPAQHALLKTLEEPPIHAILILTAENEKSLLPTILSRCQIITLKSKLLLKTEQTEITKNILNSSFGCRLLLVDQFARSKDLALKFCDQQIIYWHDQILKSKSFQLATLLKDIHQAKLMLQSNVNPSLVLGNLLLSYPQ